MNSNINHHFVPEVYLKRFSFDTLGNLYKLNINRLNKYPKTREVNKSQICYKKYLYKYENDSFLKANRLNDSNFIEKNSFQYENNLLNELFNQLEIESKFLKSQFRMALHIMIDIKKRNPKLLDFYLKFTDYDKNLDLHSKRLLSELIQEGVPEKEITQIMRRAEKTLKSDLKRDDYLRDLYRNSILRFDQETVKIENELIDKLIDWECIIYYTDFDNPFITSDNPGFTVKNFEEIYNMNFDHVSQFIFPLSPLKLCLLIKTETKKDLLIYKYLKHVKCDLDLVRYFNLGTYISADKFILSYNRKQLLITHELAKYNNGT